MSPSYPPTTPLPWGSPTSLSPHKMPLPDNDEELVVLCLWIDAYLDDLWDNYLNYCQLVSKPEATKIFAIIFTEMDFFEIIKSRAMDKMASRMALGKLDGPIL